MVIDGMQVFSALESQVLSRSAEERRHLRDLLDRSLGGEIPAIGARRLEFLMNGMEGAMGERPVLACRTPRFIWAKAMIARQLLSEGMTLTAVGECLRMNHTSVLHLRRKMDDALSNPEFFPDVMHTWNEFQQRINDTQIHN